MITRRHLLATAALTALVARRARARELRGAGSSFVAPLMQAWIEAYSRSVLDGAFLQYLSTGSGEGIRRFLDGEVDFAGTERPLTDEETAKAPHGAVHVPVAAGMVTVAYNLPGVTGQLKLSPDALAGIFRGDITRWDHPRLQLHNPDLDLPSRNITVVARRDGSGTTYVFTTYLDAIDPGWSTAGPGIGQAIDWPGSAMTAYGNEGVSAKLAITYDSIGYVEQGFATRLGLTTALIQNSSNYFVAATPAAGAAALAGVADIMPADGRQMIAGVFGREAYPIIGYSWVLLPTRSGEPGVAEALRSFITFALGADGQAIADELGYVPLPVPVLDRAAALLGSVV